MKIKFYSYQLVPHSPPNSLVSLSARQGALLQIEFEDGRIGYGDCFPWPELGDHPLQAQLELLRHRKLTPLTERSLDFAQIDANARASQTHLFSDLKLPLNHFLITDLKPLTSTLLTQISDEGFRHLKIKVGKDPENEAFQLMKLSSLLKDLDLKIRLDFNSSLNEKEFGYFLEDLGPAIQQLDFVEDPIPFDSMVWKSIQNHWKIRLAVDRVDANELKKVSKENTSVMVIKPAIQNVSDLLSLSNQLDLSVVFTSYMDHPLGQLCAAWSAGRALSNNLNRIETAGLLSHRVYQNHSLSKLISNQGPRLIPPSGSGMGGDSFLKELDWKLLH